jgi:hypothetical protein
MIKLGRDLVPEQPPRPAGTDSPRLDVLGVAPDEVAEGALVGDLLGAGDDADLVDGADFRGKAAVHAEHGAIDNGGEDEEVEDLAAGFPDGGVAVFLLAFFVEAVDLGDLAGFVVAADEDYPVGVSGGLLTGCTAEGSRGRFSYFAFRHIRRVNVSKLK